MSEKIAIINFCLYFRCLLIIPKHLLRLGLAKYLTESSASPRFEAP